MEKLLVILSRAIKRTFRASTVLAEALSQFCRILYDSTGCLFNIVIQSIFASRTIEIFNAQQPL
jgi:hypothetical protein